MVVSRNKNPKMLKNIKITLSTNTSDWNCHKNDPFIVW